MVSQRRQGGFGLIFALFLIAMVALSVTAAALLATTEMKRDRERALLFVGDQYRRAIRDYYLAVPGQQHYPANLQDLIEDPRFAQVVRHLREVYMDPVSGEPMREIRDPLDHGITGVYSPALGEPLKVAGFPEADRDFNGAKRYADWRFEFVLPTQGSKAGVKRGVNQ